MTLSARRATVAASALIALSGLTACASSAGTPSATKSSAAGSVPSPTASPSAADSQDVSMKSMIMITDFEFQGPGSVQPGAEVAVMNTDSEAHTVTADGAGGFDVKVDPGKTVTLKAPATAGTYKFHCAYHSNMHGSLTVR